MEQKKTRNRILACLAAFAVIAAAVAGALTYGTNEVTAGVYLPGRQAEVEAVLLAKEPEPGQAHRVTAPVQAIQETDVQPLITADMALDFLTESGFYPEQEAAQEIIQYDLTHQPEPEPVYEEPVRLNSLPAEPEPVHVPQEPVRQPEPVYTDNQQEGCVGDGLTY